MVNPYAGTVANTAMGGYNPMLYENIRAANAAAAAAAPVASANDGSTGGMAKGGYVHGGLMSGPTPAGPDRGGSGGWQARGPTEEGISAGGGPAVSADGLRPGLPAAAGRALALWSALAGHGVGSLGVRLRQARREHRRAGQGGRRRQRGEAVVSDCAAKTYDAGV